MRTLELVTPLPAPAAVAWEALTDVERWPEWGTLAVAARGRLQPGSRWIVELRDRRRPMTPRLLSVAEGERLVFETTLGAAALVRMTHGFAIEPIDAERSVLRQGFVATGVLVGPLWSQLHAGMSQFSVLGDDLARHLGGS